MRREAFCGPAPNLLHVRSRADLAPDPLTCRGDREPPSSGAVRPAAPRRRADSGQGVATPQRRACRQVFGVGRQAQGARGQRARALRLRVLVIVREVGGARGLHAAEGGRTIEREEYSNERVAERPGNVGVSRAGPLDAELLRAGPRFPLPDAEALRSLPPAYRRLVLEYFDRLNRGGDPAATTGRVPGGSPER